MTQNSKDQAVTLARRSPAARVPRNIGLMLAVFFGAALVWSVLDLIPSRSSTPEPEMSGANRKAQTAHVDALVKEVMDRPLFSSDRTPPPPPPSAAELAALQRPVLKSHLVGITIHAGGRQALFVADGNKYIPLREGEAIDGFKVQSIMADHVVLASAFGEQIVQPFKGTYQTVKNTKPVSLGSFDPDKN